MDKTLVFTHLPKTGGTTLYSILKREYHRKEIYVPITCFSLAAVKKIDPSTFVNARLIRGHLIFGVHNFVTRECTYTTLLRHPFHRVFSSYCHVLNHQEHPLHQMLIDQKISLERYVSEGMDIDNLQVRWLVGEDASPQKHPFMNCPKSFLKRAIENLTYHFSVVGLTEFFDESLLLMKKNFGWKNIFYLKENVNPSSGGVCNISSASLRVIREHNELDLELYAFVEKKFKKEIKLRGSEFKIEVERFKILNRMIPRMGSEAMRFASCF